MLMQSVKQNPRELTRKTEFPFPTLKFKLLFDNRMS